MHSSITVRDIVLNLKVKTLEIVATNKQLVNRRQFRKKMLIMPLSQRA